MSSFVFFQLDYFPGSKNSQQMIDLLWCVSSFRVKFGQVFAGRAPCHLTKSECPKGCLHDLNLLDSA